MPDEEWLPLLAATGEWVVISGDYNIYKNPHRRQVWRDSSLTTFFLKDNWMNQEFWLQTWWLVRWWPRFIEEAARAPRGTGFLVPAQPTGRLERLRP